jgi:hypothetical protein
MRGSGTPLAGIRERSAAERTKNQQLLPVVQLSLLMQLMKLVLLVRNERFATVF